MTASQNKHYWRVWGEVRRMLIELGEFSSADAAEERHAIHVEALGCEKSSKDFTNKDLDAVLDHFEKRLVLLRGPVTGDRTTEQPVKRLIWAIDQLGLDEPYIESISLAQFKTANWRELTERQLSLFRMTLTARGRAKKRATGSTSDQS